MTKRERQILVGLGVAIIAVLILSQPQCKGLCRGIAAQLESAGIGDLLSGLFG
jgi:hypothetical protein